MKSSNNRENSDLHGHPLSPNESFSIGNGLHLIDFKKELAWELPNNSGSCLDCMLLCTKLQEGPLVEDNTYTTNSVNMKKSS